MSAESSTLPMHQSGDYRGILWGGLGAGILDIMAAIISLGAAILGPITVGPRARVGANAVVTKDVAEGQVVVGIPARPMLVDAREYQKGFVPYGTPCSERFDPQTQQLEILRCELETLRGRIAMLIDERDAARAKLAEDRERA